MIDKTIMTDVAIALRNGETVMVDRVKVKFTESERLETELPNGMSGDMFIAWLRKNADEMGYVIPANYGENNEIAVKGYPHKAATEDFKPLEPHAEA